MQPIQKILVPVDFSETSESAARYALAVAQSLGAELELMHVWELPHHLMPYTTLGDPAQAVPFFGVAEDEIKKEMTEFLSRLEQGMVQIMDASRFLNLKHRLEQGRASDTIIHLAQKEGFDLIIMGTHGRRGLRHMVMGSVAEDVVRASPCPVLTVGPKWDTRFEVSADASPAERASDA